MTFANTAARAAGNRAAECRLRLAELTSGRRVVAQDVYRAQRALKQAIERAQRAQVRLLDVQQRQEARRIRPSVEPAPRTWPVRQQPDVREVRQTAAELPIGEVFPAYLSLGGRCGALELDGFINAVIDLPAGELAILAHAVWELTELSTGSAS